MHLAEARQEQFFGETAQWNSAATSNRNTIRLSYTRFGQFHLSPFFVWIILSRPKKCRWKAPVAALTQQSALEGMLNGFLRHFFKNALYIHTYLQESMKLRTPSQLINVDIIKTCRTTHSKWRKWSEHSQLLVEGVDAIAGSIPLTILHPATHGNSLLLPDPIHVVKNWTGD